MSEFVDMKWKMVSDQSCPPQVNVAPATLAKPTCLFLHAVDQAMHVRCSYKAKQVQYSSLPKVHRIYSLGDAGFAI